MHDDQLLTRKPVSFHRYRLAPKHPYPVPFEDSLKATTYFLNNAKLFNVDPERVVIMGQFHTMPVYLFLFSAL